MSDLDKARERYASALRSTFVSRSEPEVGKTYDLVDEDAADSLIAALGDEIAELTGQNIDLEVWRASAVKRAEQAEAALSAEREKKCLACRWWNPARFDDWGCCQNPDVDMGKKFTPTYPARFGCALFERRQP